MLANRSCVAVLGVLVLCVGWAGSASGQIIGSARIRQESYRVKIVSHFGIPVTVGIFGRQTDATFRLRFDGGRTGPDVYTQNLIAGQRVVCVWDSSGDLLFIADLNIDASGTLELPGPAEYRGGSPGRGSHARRGGCAGSSPTTESANAQDSALRRNEVARLRLRADLNLPVAQLRPRDAA